MMRRRVKQISTCFVINEDFEEIFIITALCDDGTMWRRIEGGNYNGKWGIIENVPQMPIHGLPVTEEGPEA